MAILSRTNSRNCQSEIHAALRAWHTTGGTPDNLLASFLLVQERRSKLAKSGNQSLLRLATNQVLNDAIEALASQDETAAHILRLRFPDNNTLAMVANKLNISEHSVSRLQRSGIEHLAEIIWSRELTLRQDRALATETNLPPPSYRHLVGIDEARDTLAAQLVQAQAPWVIAIVGIGGIGKTALADSVTRQAIRQFHFDKVFWLRTEPHTMSGHSHGPRLTFENLVTDLSRHLWPDSAGSLSPQQRLVQVRQALKTRPCLIIVDNLESETDTAFLLDHLNDLAQPSKFLLTSRTRLSEQAAVFNLSLDELGPDDAVALIHSHAEDTGVAAVATLTAADTQAIYEVAGGNPLALKLVVSLLDVMPLAPVLANLQHGRQGAVEALYHRIYRQTWQLLSAEARALLQAMPLVAEAGGTVEYLQKISTLSEAQLWPALLELRNRSLLEVRGTVHDKRYGIHRLTETFLHTEIINWPEADRSL